MKVLMVDPDGGWRYGFPKIAPENLEKNDDWHAWLLEEGYPQEKIDYWLNSSFGYVPCRMWEQEIEDD